MPRPYGYEFLLDDIKAILKANLNNEIISINADNPSDGIVLGEVDGDAYFLQGLNGKTANFNPFIFYGVSGALTKSNGPDSICMVSVEIIIIFEDGGRSEDEIARTAFRYIEALRTVLKNNWYLGTNSNKLEMEDLLPIPFTKLNSSQKSRATGVKIITSIA